jgi:UDP-hydrolysing UDP-N-acetyl-D-glucosamine 2-epimerase
MPRGPRRSPRRRICVVTSTRADYGLLRWLMEEIRVDRRLQLQIVATGTHLAPRFGHTVDAIADDGFTVDRTVNITVDGDDARATAQSTARAVAGLADAFSDLQPDIVVLLGDRFEVLAAAQAALYARIPVAHLHGGERSDGAIDDSLRHAITKLSHLHFVAAPAYRQRVIQLGEAPAHVFCFGPLATDNFHRLSLLTPELLGRDLGLPIGEGPLFLVTYHPATLGRVAPARATAALLSALDRQREGLFLFTGSNADPGHAAIAPLIEGFVARHPGRARFVASLGQLRYLSALRAAAVVVGNSSSGIIEAPLCGTPTVNVGERQRGRLRAPSVIDATETAPAVTRALTTALSPKFRRRLSKARLAAPVAPRIRDVLAHVSLVTLTEKRFRDLPARR